MSALPYHCFCPYDGTALVSDPEDKPLRPRCPRCKYVDYQNPRPCVAVLIQKGDEVLMARRGIEPAFDEWDIPGGFLNPAESAETAAVREAREETDLDVRLVHFLGSIPDTYGSDGIPTLNLGFVAEIVSGTVRAQSDVAALEWMPADRFPERMAFAHQGEMLRRWQDYRGGLSASSKPGSRGV